MQEAKDLCLILSKISNTSNAQSSAITHFLAVKHSVCGYALDTAVATTKKSDAEAPLSL
tara:strand:+ start:412 stop:588 length:177 start_codon:yes stop_codon:yes gene_type:complete